MVGREVVTEKLMWKMLQGNNVCRETGREEREDILPFLGDIILFFKKIIENLSNSM